MGNREVRNLLVIAVLLLATWIILPDVVHSQTQEAFTQAYTLGEVVVSADKEVVEAVGTVREVTSEDIKNKGARTLDEDGQFDPTLIPVEDIDKIKVSYGDHSVLYGDGGLGISSRNEGKKGCMAWS